MLHSWHRDISYTKYTNRCFSISYVARSLEWYLMKSFFLLNTRLNTLHIYKFLWNYTYMRVFLLLFNHSNYNLKEKLVLYLEAPKVPWIKEIVILSSPMLITWTGPALPGPNRSWHARKQVIVMVESHLFRDIKKYHSHQYPTLGCECK